MAQETISHEGLFQGAPAHWGANFTKTIHSKPTASIDPAKTTLPGGYTVVVTGAGKGLGEYIAKAYVEAKASNVIITSRTASNLEKVKRELEDIASKSGRSVKVTVCPGDASKPESYLEVKRLLENQYGGRLDCLVCNAGGGNMVTGWEKHLHKTDTNEWDDVTYLNYLGPFYAAKHLIPLMLNTPGAGKTLINISSGASHLNSLSPNAYNISKLALNRLTENIGENYEGEGLVAIALNPGIVMTPGADPLPEFMKARK